MKITQLETPALIIDTDILEKNQQRMNALTESIGAALRHSPQKQE